MQFKYKSRDLIVHKNSVELIKMVIKKLIEIDDYDFIFVEGQFRYPEVYDNYVNFLKNNTLKNKWFQFNLNLEEMKKRDVDLRNTKSKNIEEVKKDIDSFTPKGSVIVDTSIEVEESVDKIIEILKK
jgi:hypothetical protein